MTIRFFSFICFYCLIPVVSGQNLVPNPSFEVYENGCPENFHDIPVDWEWWRNSPNSFSTCVEPETLIDSLGWAPWNGFGFQDPFDGNAFVGMYVCNPQDWNPFVLTDFREYMGCALTEPLEAGVEYYVSFYASAAFGNYYYPTWATSHLGVYFSNTDYDWLENPLEIPNQSQVYSEEILSDTVNWIEISGSFIADDNYSHMGIGVFFEFEYTDTLDFVPGLTNSLGGYVYVDQICVSAAPNCEVSSEVSDSGGRKYSIYPNPSKGIIKVKGLDAIFRIVVSDLYGMVVHTGVIQPFNSINLSHLTSGTYILNIYNTKNILTEKLVIVD